MTKPLLKMLRRFDSSAPAASKVFSSSFEAGEHLKATTSTYKASCLEAHEERWALGVFRLRFCSLRTRPRVPRARHLATPRSPRAS